MTDCAFARMPTAAHICLDPFMARRAVKRLDVGPDALSSHSRLFLIPVANDTPPFSVTRPKCRHIMTVPARNEFRSNSRASLFSFQNLPVAMANQASLIAAPDTLRRSGMPVDAELFIDCYPRQFAGSGAETLLRRAWEKWLIALLARPVEMFTASPHDLLRLPYFGGRTCFTVVFNQFIGV